MCVCDALVSVMTINEIEHIVHTLLVRDYSEELTKQQIAIAAHDIALLIVAELSYVDEGGNVRRK